MSRKRLTGRFLVLEFSSWLRVGQTFTSYAIAICVELVRVLRWSALRDEENLCFRLGIKVATVLISGYDMRFNLRGFNLR